MNGRQGAFEIQGRLQLFEREVRTLRQLRTEGVVVFRQLGFTSRAMMLRAQIAQTPPLLEELFHHAKRDAIALRNVLPGALLIIVSGQDPFPQIKGEGAHAHGAYFLRRRMATVLFKLL